MFLNARAFEAFRIDIWEITQWYSYTSLSETRWNSKFEILTEFGQISAATLNLYSSASFKATEAKHTPKCSSMQGLSLHIGLTSERLLDNIVIQVLVRPGEIQNSKYWPNSAELVQLLWTFIAQSVLKLQKSNTHQNVPQCKGFRGIKDQHLGDYAMI